jgi:metal-responsive CopG/Arc/MetJ family transcriptional regulator
MRIGGLIMDSETVRLNITLPKGLVDAMNRMTEPRKRSRFIAEAVRHKIEQKEKEEMEKLLVEGYRAAAKESLTITKEFENTDLEGWDAY